MYAQQSGQKDQVMQIIQMYAQMNQMDPKQLISKLKQLPAEQQQQALQEMAQVVQQAASQQSAMQQPDMQQAAMMYGGYTTGIFADGGEPNGGMAIGQMAAVADKMNKLRQFVSADQNLDPWIASKLAVMDHSADAISDYMMYNQESQEEMMDQPEGLPMEEMKMGGIPERYKNMGFNKVGAKKDSTRPGKKWMVLAKKGDQYKVVHGGYDGMKDFSQHGSEKRKENFWNRMGGKNSAKATDPFSPLYWHKRFGTWQEGGQKDSLLENVAEIFDLSGVTSYDDVYRSYKKSGMSPETFIELLGAVPLLGKAAKLTQEGIHLKKYKGLDSFLYGSLPRSNKLSNGLTGAAVLGRGTDAVQAGQQFKTSPVFPFGIDEKMKKTGMTDAMGVALKNGGSTWSGNAWYDMGGYVPEYGMGGMPCYECGGMYADGGSYAIGSEKDPSIVNYLASRGDGFSYAERAELAKEFGIQDYKGTAAQNLKLLDFLRKAEQAGAANVPCIPGPDGRCMDPEAVMSQPPVSPSQVSNPGSPRPGKPAYIQPEDEGGTGLLPYFAGAAGAGTLGYLGYRAGAYPSMTGMGSALSGLGNNVLASRINYPAVESFYQVNMTPEQTRQMNNARRAAIQEHLIKEGMIDPKSKPMTKAQKNKIVNEAMEQAGSYWDDAVRFGQKVGSKLLRRRFQEGGEDNAARRAYNYMDQNNILDHIWNYSMMGSSPAEKLIWQSKYGKRNPMNENPVVETVANIGQYFVPYYGTGLIGAQLATAMGSNNMSAEDKGVEAAAAALPYGVGKVVGRGIKAARNMFKQQGGPVVGQEMDVTPEEAEILKQMGYTFETI